MAEENIFDTEYVSKASTGNEQVDKSTLKTFLKSPVSEVELKSYGSSKPKRVKIRAIIQHGKS